jgi:hypothetical protein
MQDSIWKINKIKKGWEYGSNSRASACKCEALSSNCTTTTKKKRNEKKVVKL